MTGIFISLEGPEGAGKTTQREYIREALEKAGRQVVVTREPGGTSVAEELREVLLRPRDERIYATTEALLFYAARIQHIEEVIKPAIQAGRVVLCDRFFDSTHAYQNARGELPVGWLDSLQQLTIGDFKPDLTILFDLPVEVGMKRAAARGVLDRFEQSGWDFFERVRANFIQRWIDDPERIEFVNAEWSLEQVREQVRRILTLRGILPPG